MSDTATLTVVAPPAAEVAFTVPAAPAKRSPRVDFFALTRALVFTKESYRKPKPEAAAKPTARSRQDVDEKTIEAALAAASTALADNVPAFGLPATTPAAATKPAEKVAAKANLALTPWDMMDDEDANEGVTFSLFQHRSVTVARQEAA